MRQVTDIRHLLPGYKEDDVVTEDYARFHTSIDSLMYDDAPAPRATEEFHRPRISCNDVMRHVQMCPVCSKLYTVKGDIRCDDSGCSVVSYKGQPVDIAMVIMFLLIFLILVKLFTPK